MRYMTRKVISVLIIISLSTLFFSACSVTDKLTLLNALEKNMKIKSMESKSNINVRLGVTGIPQENLEQIGSLIPIDENLNIKTRQKHIENAAGLNSQIDTTLSYGGSTINSSLWTQNNISGEQPLIKQIIKLPSQMLNFLPPEFSGREYMVIDQNDIMGTGMLDTDEYTKIMKNTSKFQEKLIDFLKEYAMNFDPDFADIHYEGEKTVNNQTLKIYELKLTDATFKKLIKYSIDNITQNEKVKELVKELTSLMDGMTNGTDPGEGLDNALDKFTDGTTGFREDVNKVMNALDSVQFLGNRGITVELGINDEGYIVDQRGVADFIINFHEIEKAMRKASGDNDYYNEDNFISPEIVLTLDTDFNTEIFNINKNIELTFPELTNENSFGLKDLANIIPIPGE
jgi:hypothetical protein